MRERSMRIGFRTISTNGLSLAAALIVITGVCCRRADDARPGASTSSETPTKAAPTGSLGGEGFNVLFVSVDTTRADHIGCYGHPDIKTPSIDRLAREGTRFANCISSAPLTMPSHSTMMTGAYPYVHGVRDNGIFQLKDENRTLAEIFLEAGYRTHAEVAAPVLDAKYGLDQGFESYSGISVDTDAELVLLPFGGRGDQHEEPLAASDEPAIEPELPDIETDRKADEITEHAVAQLRKYAESKTPFFMFVHYFDPHWPWEAPEPFSTEFHDPYMAEIAYFDSQFGLLIDAVRELGLSEKTLVILTSDHGEGRGEHAERTHSTFLYDTTLHVPLVIWCPGQVPAEQVVESQVRLIDLAPTILEFCGLGDQRTPQMQGTSLVPLLLDPTSNGERWCYSDTMVPYTSYDYSWLRSLRTDDWKYIHGPKPELYHVAEDRRELFNLADAERERAEAMKQQLYDLIADSPSPPGSGGNLMAMSDEERRQFEALGYVSDALDEDSPLVSGDEIDNFEPKGPNPRDKAEVIACVATGMGCFRVGDFEQSVPIWERYVELEPDEWTGWSHLGRAYMAVKEFEKARASMQRAIELNPASPDDYRRLANLYAQESDFIQAEAFYRKAIEVNPEDPVAHLNLGKILRSKRAYEEALTHFDRAIEIEAKLCDAWVERGITLRQMDRIEEAVEALRTGVEIDPNETRGHLQLAGVYLMDMGQSQQALDYLASVLDRVENKAAILQGMADGAMTAGDYAASLNYVEQLLEIDPDGANAHRLRGQALTALGRTDEGIDSYRKAVELEGEFHMARLQLADALDQAGRDAESVEAFAALLANSPPQPIAYTRAAETFLKAGDVDRAVDAYRAGREAAPQNVNIPNDLAWLLATHPSDAVRNGEAAVEAAEYARKLTRGEHAAVMDTLAAAYAEAGRFDEAVAAADAAISLARERDDAALVERITKRREMYTRAEPYRDNPRPATSTAPAAPAGATQ